MASLVETLMKELESRGTVDQIATKLGVPQAQVNSAFSAAVPAILAGIAQNTKQPEGAAALAGALDRDHDGSVLDDDGYFDRYEESKGDNILGHVFGDGKPAVESQVSALGGMSSLQGADLMKMLAPLVMGYLGKQKSSGGLDISSLSQVLLGGGGGAGGGLKLPGGLGDLLGGLSGAATQSNNQATAKPAANSPSLGGILGKFFGKKNR